ncbi:putative S-adenosyl-L-methionine-dependent methyltransferase [Dillenia turbinata]|uniref:S-adenosyl-L-methionine-dependent methyltransferase n=1 Tax=Dillenia turbinata TaxID=194707 RepID=A0AAN8Z303_9MAGN
MAIGKPRSNKRSSSSSFTSTITTVVFVALCVVGVWMLNSNSVITPQNASRAAINTASDHQEVIKPTTVAINKKDDQFFEDNPGDVSNDAVSEEMSENKPHEDDKNNDDDEAKSQEEQKRAVEALQSEKEAIAAEASQGKTEMPMHKPNEDDKNNDDDDKSQEEKKSAVEALHSQNQASAGEAIDGHSSTDNANDNSHGSKGNESAEEEEKQNEHGTQVTEESSMHQHIKETNINQNQKDRVNEDALQIRHEVGKPSSDDTPDKFQGQTLSAGSESERTPANTIENKNQVSDVDQHLRLQEQNQKQEDQKKQETTETNNDETLKQEEQQLEQENEVIESTQQSEAETFDQSSKQTTENNKNQNESNRGSHLGKSNLNQNSPSDISMKKQERITESNSAELFSGIPKESKESKKAWSTQADQSENQKERRQDRSDGKESIYGYTWQLCNVTAGPDYIPCLDNEKAISQLHSRKHFEHRERHCPEEGPTCLVATPEGYKRPIEWPTSRDKIWYHNVPHTKLAEVKGHQNWVKVTGEFLTFPGGGTQFIHGALHYIDFIQEAVPNIAWGKHTRVILDVGCGVASFGGYLFERDVLAMSFAPKDEHEAQVQFALERGIPAISAVMGSQRLPFPSRVFDLVHCARCRVPWHIEGGRLLLELNRVLRPGGYFVWSATPVYQTLEEDVQIWKEMSALTESMCWELVTIKKDQLNSIGAAIYRKPTSNDCYDQRNNKNPPMCKSDDDPDAAWYVPLQSCMHHIPIAQSERGTRWPESWPQRIQTPPYWLNSSQMGIYGKPAPTDFAIDYEHWKKVVNKSYLSGLGISWDNVRNVMDMRAVYGGFAAALKDLKIWVMNVINTDSPDTLPIIYERGLFGIYHDWCESFSTYPRTYDLLHADHLFSRLRKRCKIAPVMAEIDRIVRPGGKLIVRDESKTIGEVENILKSLHWEVHLTFSKDQEGMVSAQKSDWRPESYAASS